MPTPNNAPTTPRRFIAPLFAIALMIFLGVSYSQSDPPTDWRTNMRKVHARFTCQKGTFAHFGDSITDTMAFWTPLPYERKNASPEMEKAFTAVKAYLRPECWREWKGPDYGNQGGQTTQWALKNI